MSKNDFLREIGVDIEMETNDTDKLVEVGDDVPSDYQMVEETKLNL